MKKGLNNKIKYELKEIEYSLYPILNQFVHQDKKIDEYAVNKLHDSLIIFRDNLAKELVFQGENVKYIHYVNNIIDNLGQFLKKIFKIARARDRFDSRNSLLNTINSLKELSYFTSAVTLGVIVTTLHLDTGITLGILGVIGLVTYFINDIITLNKQLRSEKLQNSVKYEYKEVKNIISELEKLSQKEQAKRIAKLEKILISPEPMDVLDYTQVIELKHLYFHFIKGKNIYLVRKDEKAPKNIKEIFELINKFIENISQIIVFSLVAVDSNRPLIKKKNIFSRLINIRGIIKFIGYVMLNAISYNLFYTHLVDDIGIVMIIALILIISFTYAIMKFETYMIGELTKTSES